MIGHGPRFRQDRIRRPAALLAPCERHHAIGAELVAALDDGDVPAVLVGPCGVVGLKGLVGLAVVQSGHTRFPCLQLHQHLRQVAVTGRAAYQRHVRCALEDVLAFLLRHTPQHAELLSLLLERLVIGQAVEHLLLCLVADRAGVVQDQARLFHRRHLPVALRNERADDFFGVVDIHLAAECFEVEGLFGGYSHAVKSITEGRGFGRRASGSGVTGFPEARKPEPDLIRSQCLQRAHGRRR